MLYKRQQARQDEEERRVIKLEETFQEFIARKYEQYYNSPKYKNNKVVTVAYTESNRGRAGKGLNVSRTSLENKKDTNRSCSSTKKRWWN